MACGVAVNQGTQADLVGDALAGEALGDDPDHDAEHRHPTVEALDLLELLRVNQLFSAVLAPLICDLVVVHDCWGSDLSRDAAIQPRRPRQSSPQRPRGPSRSWGDHWEPASGVLRPWPFQQNSWLPIVSVIFGR